MKKNDYLGNLKTLIETGSPRLAKRHRLAFKNCFGAIAGYVDDNIFISCGKFGVALRLPPRILADLFKEAGVTPLKYFPNGHVKKEYAVIPSRILDNRARFRQLLDKSIKYAYSRK
ncbi:MAG: TfoX/Sxy family protein [Acidobacteria bacterium]|nr:TfoX/Sxy family protein [Acidobacteriota bacterium]MBI3663911.1 TfoX/Sxy family protein [Acidobacteriota bacterium]